MQRGQMVELLAAHLADVRLAHPVRVALDGMDAAGKTCLADELAQALEKCHRPVIRASIDGFHQPKALRYARGKDSPEGYFLDSFDYQRLRQELLDPLGPGGSCRIRRAVFDYRKDRPLDLPVEIADPQAVLLFDGIFLLRPELAAAWDMRIFVQVAFETSLARALQRDQELFGNAQAVRQRYQLRYFPAQRQYIESCNPQLQADVIVLNDHLEDPEIRWRRLQGED